MDTPRVVIEAGEHAVTAALTEAGFVMVEGFFHLTR